MGRIRGNAVMKAGRIMEMERYILSKGAATMEELQQFFGVSMNTIRRDVAELIEKGTVSKVYGGVCVRQGNSPLTPYDIRLGADLEAKMSIGRRAASLVQDGDVIFLDSGTTTLRMVDYLSEVKELTVITNNLEAILHAFPYENIRVVALPGELRRKTNSFTGVDAVRYLKHYNIRTAFLAATGVSLSGATNSSSLEYEIKQAAVENSGRSVLLIQHGKFGVTGLMTYAPLSDFDTIVTNALPPQAYVDHCREQGIRLMVADQ